VVLEELIYKKPCSGTLNEPVLPLRPKVETKLIPLDLNSLVVNLNERIVYF